MTKFDYFKQLEKEDKYDEIILTWKALGSQKATASTKIYTKDSLYLVKVKKSSLIDCLILCLNDVIISDDKKVSWEKANIFDYGFGEITFGNNIISPDFKIILIKEDYDSVDQTDEDFKKRYEDFIPYEKLNKKDTLEVKISEDDYKRCISVLGSPFITEEELEYSRQDIIDLAIKPAIEEYFHWVPAVRPTIVDSFQGTTGTSKVTEKEYYDYPDSVLAESGKVYYKKESTGSDTYEYIKCNPQPEIGSFVGNLFIKKYKRVSETSDNNTSGDGSIEVDMPSDAYGVVGLSLQQSGQSLNTNILSPMFYAMEQSLYSGYSYTNLSGVYNGRTPFTNTNSLGGMLQSRAASQGLINYTRRVHYEGPYERSDGSRFIKVYSTVSGVFNVWWAINTLDFDKIEFANRRRVIEYAQACVKELFANLRRQAKSDLPGQFDYGTWLNEAKEQKDKITEEWKKLVKYSGVMRGSL